MESERCASYTKALEHGKPTPVEIEATLADGLAVPMVGYNAFHTAKPLVDKVVSVKYGFHRSSTMSSGLV